MLIRSNLIFWFYAQVSNMSNLYQNSKYLNILLLFLQKYIIWRPFWIINYAELIKNSSSILPDSDSACQILQRKIFSGAVTQIFTKYPLFIHLLPDYVDRHTDRRTDMPHCQVKTFRSEINNFKSHYKDAWWKTWKLKNHCFVKRTVFIGVYLRPIHHA